MIDHINQFALEIIKITGKDIDRDRTWKLTKYLPETESYLSAYNTIVKYMVINLSEYSDKEDLSSSLSFLKKAVIEFEKMLQVPDELPLYLNNLYSGTSSITLMLGDSLTTLNNQQLFLDGFYVSNDQYYDRANATIFERFGSGVSSFFSSFVSDKYKVINEEDTINVWVNRPLTYVDIMQKMADSQFTEETGLKVKISVMPDANKLILANSAGNTPDIALGLASYMPFDLAIRGALYDLSEFDDFWLVANDFAPGALVPYILEDGVYAIPETLEFNALVYRKDVFKSLELEVPDTWDDVVGILPTLQRYDMNFYYPTSGGTALKWFYQTSPLIYQNGGSLYAEDGLSTTINSEESYQGLKLLGDLYTTYSLPEQVPLFFNSFRYNKLPVGIIDFNTYMQLKNAAPELVGQWALAPYPGVYNEETDSVERWYIGNGTGGAMFKNSDNPEGSWEFMKWWMSTETQTEFAYTLQGTYGPEFLWLSGNLSAVESSPLDNDDKQIILEQIKWLRDVPRTPGQYMLERGLSNIWNTVTFDGTPMRVAIDKEVIVINREIRRKMIEFGYMDADGNTIKPYIIRDVDWIQIQMDNALAGDN
jgi:ABC-type glycerol-3-phosphate transport system substrate-binding protein